MKIFLWELEQAKLLYGVLCCIWHMDDLDLCKHKIEAKDY